MERILICIAIMLCACDGNPRPGELLPRLGDEISVCGQLFHTGTTVVLWNDPGGYDAYRSWNRFSAADPAASESADATLKPRYSPMRGRLPPEIAERVEKRGWHLEDLQEVVHLFVIHYDAAGTSRQCFKVLQDLRGLSVHFMLDLDGTLYQTLDLKERAWHATSANSHSIGIEIAHIGAYPQPGHPVMRSWYEKDAAGLKLKLPGWIKETGIRTPDFIARPAREELQTGSIHGKDWYQYDFTGEQYAALAKLTATLTEIFPRIPLRVPRNTDGRVLADALSERELDTFEGIIGHWHVTARKQDPGPAFDWERLLRESR